MSKEWPGSIVIETLKNWILIPIDASKELYFYAYFKYISFTTFNLTHQKLRAWENLLHFRKRRKHPLKVIESYINLHHWIQRIREPRCRGLNLLFTKMGNFMVFCQKKDQMFFCFFFRKGYHIDPTVLKYCQRAYQNRN